MRPLLFAVLIFSFSLAACNIATQESPSDKKKEGVSSTTVLPLQ